MTQVPEEFYRNTDYNKETMFGFATAVHSDSPTSQTLFSTLIFIFIFSQEMLFITATEINNPKLLEEFNEKFYLELPLKDVPLEFGSEVRNQLSTTSNIILRRRYYAIVVGILNSSPSPGCWLKLGHLNEANQP